MGRRRQTFLDIGHTLVSPGLGASTSLLHPHSPTSKPASTRESYVWPSFLRLPSQFLTERKLLALSPLGTDQLPPKEGPKTLRSHHPALVPLTGYTL